MGKRAIRAISGRLTYANVAATLALVLAMSGGALAASHYLINSTKQINPKVLKTLRGARGPRGQLGPNGVVGPQGTEGPAGQRGLRGERGEPGFSALSNLPKSATESGEFAIPASYLKGEDFFEGAVSFPIPLAAPIEKQIVITPIGTPTPQCHGPGLAERGWLCIYTKFVAPILKFERAFNPEAVAEVEAPGTTGRFGFGLTFKVKKEEEGKAEASGTWSVTSP
jgi:hypothetical protein